MTPEQVVEKARTSGVELVRFLYCDNGGIIRGKLTDVDNLAGRIQGGIGLTVAMQAFNMLDHLVAFEGMGPVGEVRLMPDPTTFKVLPYTPGHAAMIADLVALDGLVAALKAMGIPVDLYYPEYGPGQHELTIRHAEALTAADNQIFYRDVVRSVAANHGLYATLAPKPFPDAPGNGCHIHCSLWDESRTTNLLWSDDDAYHFSRLGYHFIGGVLAHLPGLVALTAPTYNSYRRLKPHMWASAFTAWGPDNREGAVRIASPFWGHEKASINFELKASDASNNPYLALGGLIAAGLDGVARELEPGEPALDDPANLGDGELARRGIARLPGSLAEAVAHLERDGVLMEALGPTLARSFIAVKQSEYAAFAQGDVDFEIKHHFYVF